MPAQPPPRSPARRLARRVLLAGGAVFLALQCFRPEKNTGGTPPPSDFLVSQTPPPAVSAALRDACYDCHSDHTRYPWYAALQPAGWWLAAHVRDGKAALNFSSFSKASGRQQARMLDEISVELSNGTMPPRSYRLMHAAARLTPQQRQEITHWIDQLCDEVDGR